ncbi:MAG: alpha-D-ribose 1-methylphosphonate 5-triphosphate diphosphatase, partial [Proteobacteria bacterium]|nr:alpha-D-ribose 1-methylphosphonate 5-triphosphate diphosphatase [Pseudomonadota bacterium]
MTEMVITNARIVLRSEEMTGSLSIKDGIIEDVNRGQSAVPGAINLEGDFLLPGFVELHSDNIEKHFAPRPGVDWPSLSAAVAHDAQMAAAGVTTVFDALRIGDTTARVGEADKRHLRMADAIHQGQRCDSFRAEHKIHVRCEVSYDGVVEGFEEIAEDPDVGLVSLMDHTPGQRQFVD